MAATGRGAPEAFAQEGRSTSFSRDPEGRVCRGCGNLEESYEGIRTPDRQGANGRYESINLFVTSRPCFVSYHVSLIFRI